jgi:hypothetical protein
MRLSGIILVVSLCGPLWPQGSNLFGPSKLIGPSNITAVANGGFTLLSHSFYAGHSNAPTPGINSTGATLLVGGVTTFGGAATTSQISDLVGGNSNTCWVGPAVAADFVSASGDQGTILVCFNPTFTGTGHTLSYTPTGGFEAVFFAAFGGGHTLTYRGTWVSGTSYNQYDISVDTAVSLPYEAINAIPSDSTPPHSDTANWRPLLQSGTTGSGTTVIASASTTALSPNSLVLSLCLENTAASISFSIDSGFTITDSAEGASSVNVGGGLAYLAQSTPATVNPTWTMTGASGLSLGVVNLFF